MNDDYQGWINLYKPKNITSFLAIKKIKKKLKINKIGHAGTLDPLAEGGLPVAIGKATKLIPFINNDMKEYIFTIKWGEQTSTDDSEGDVINFNYEIPEEKNIKINLRNFLGEIEQVPPKVSAIKVEGRRAYSLFRENKNFILSSRKVILKEAELISTNKKFSSFKIKCGKGFYVRSLARDLAEKLGTYGHISSLKRTKVGFFSSINAILLDDLLKIRQTLQEFNFISSSVEVLDDILAYDIEDEKDLKDLSLGRSIIIDLKNLKKPRLNSFDKNFLFLFKKGNVLSYGKLIGNLFKPIKVLI